MLERKAASGVRIHMTIAAISGSLRKLSFNTALIRASQKLAPEGMKIELVPIDEMPLYNMDLEGDFPAAASAFKNRIRAADGVLIATPEHNFSIPGVLKNAIDWGSRPYGDSCFSGKPVIVQSASTSWVGALRAQYHLFQVLDYLEMRHLRFPEIALGDSAAKFTPDLELTDEQAIESITKQLEAFKSHVESKS